VAAEVEWCGGGAIVTALPPFYFRSHDAVIRVYDAAGKLIEVHRHKGDFTEWWSAITLRLSDKTKSREQAIDYAICRECFRSGATSVIKPRLRNRCTRKRSARFSVSVWSTASLFVS
jgi:hypothetical protein